MRSLSVGAGLVALAVCGTSANGQVAPCSQLQTPIDTDVAWCALTQLPRFVTSEPRAIRPRYPDMLRSANVAGEVVVEATVGIDGRVDMASFRVQQSTHALFSNAVKSTLPNWRFQPGEVDGKPVRARGVMRFEFLLAADTLPGIEVAEGPQITTSGLESATGWRTPPFAPPALVDTARLYAVIAAIAREFASTCLNWSPTGKGDAPTKLLDYLRGHGSPRFSLTHCPPTYASSMIAHVDSLGRPIDRRPPGAVDPTILSITRLRAWASDVYVFDVDVAQGNSGSNRHCQATWNSFDLAWKVSCGQLRYWMSSTQLREPTARLRAVAGKSSTRPGVSTARSAEGTSISAPR